MITSVISPKIQVVTAPPAEAPRNLHEPGYSGAESKKGARGGESGGRFTELAALRVGGDTFGENVANFCSYFCMLSFVGIRQYH